jgi:hypothetical protein
VTLSLRRDISSFRIDRGESLIDVGILDGANVEAHWIQVSHVCWVRSSIWT